MRIATMASRTSVRGLLGVLAVLALAVVFFAGCDLGSDQEQALEEQKQKNEELQRQLDEQKEEEARRKEREEEARQEELERQVEDLQKQVEEQSQATDTSSGTTPDSDIENSSTSPSQATEGIVVVSSDFDTAAATTEEAAVINAAIEYYQYAEVGDYQTTYNLLSSDDQTNYTQDQWVTANNVLDSAEGEFVVTEAYPDDIGLGVPTYAVAVTVYSPDGSSFDRTTYFVNEDGYWAHYLSGEEISMFDDALY